MRQSLKIALTLLISVVAFSVFALVSFSGLFNYLETSFFQPRVVKEKESQLLALAGKIEQYHEANLVRFGSLVKESYLAAAFLSQQSEEDITARANAFGKLLEDYKDLELIRILGADGKKIHFSTSPADVKSQERFSVSYRNLEEVDPAISGELLLTGQGEQPRLVLDGGKERFIYSFPVESYSVYRGSALFYLSKQDLVNFLLKMPGIAFREKLFFVGQLGIILDFPESKRQLISEALVQVWKSAAGGAVISQPVVLETAAAQKERYRSLSALAGRFGYVGILVPFSAFELQPEMKAVLLASFFFTVFLIVFLLFNLKQDALVVLSQRIKRFQIEILQELLAGKEGADWERWRRDLVASRSELKTRIKRGIGRVRTAQEPEVDGLIDRGWDEILSIIEARAGAPKEEKLDLARIEELIQRALERGKITISAAAEEARPARKPVEVEEIAAAEVAESAELVSEIEPALEEAEAVEELEAAEAEAVQAEETEELEEVPETEVSAAGATLQELEPVQEAAEELAVPTLAGADSGQVAETEEAALELEELEAAPSAVQAPEAETVPQVSEVEPVPLEAPAEQLEAAAAEAEAVPVKTEEAEALEELETVVEIVALPPEPQEALEELALVKEEKEAAAAPASAPEARAPMAGAPEASAPEARAPEARAPEEAEAELEEIAEEEAEAEEEPAQVLEEEVEELQPFIPAGVSAVEEDAELQSLLAQGIIKVYSLQDFQRLVAEQRTSIVMEEGVYRIKETLYASKESAGVAVSAAGPQSAAKAGAPELSLDEVLGIRETLDLFSGLGEGEEKEAAQELFAGKKRPLRIQLTPEGLDFDGYARSYKGVDAETGRLKALFDLSARARATGSALFFMEGGAYTPLLKVGLMDPLGSLAFLPGEPFYERLLKEPQAVLVNRRLDGVKALAKKFNEHDVIYMQGAAFLPAVFQKQPALLFLGLPLEKPWELKDFIHELNIY